MKTLAVLLVVVCVTFGDVHFTNIFKGDDEIPKDLDTAKNNNWKLVDSDDQLKISWYSLNSNPSVQLAYDKLGVLAGARLVIPKGGENEFYTKSKIFKEKLISNKPSYVATVMLTDPKILKKGGRRTTEEDEIVELVLVNQKTGSNDRIQRNACDNVNAEGNIFLEQGCKDKFGLVFAPLKSVGEDCDYPVFLVYNEEDQGEMLGFGWLAPAADIKGSKALTTEEIQDLFPSNPTCLKGKAAVSIWLAKDARDKATCDAAIPPGTFVEKRCQPKRREGMDEDDVLQ